ncbi:NUDIX-domain-containing protein [Eremomyces bilateralis CBS 781.70]|uniref:NUDIX-domain-containing protein n=1 Tax=Eremomyces bilateralis CBS 781.70 TaxID=1392243 RepID=A0A6G1FPY9_9PEZI|nr:NUDIX-domain-containing protein [Eremomyces bilateralis CBS 781.70]KAF1807895.1 NUDIX-domain-containing protein [Eremomyces bilateralis CBS 781.70]
MATATAKWPSFKFATHASVSEFCVSSQAYLANHPSEYSQYQHLAIGALVFNHSTPRRLLLIQRAASDTMPNLWEIPGGGADDVDETILHGIARELWEETGLMATSVGPEVGVGQMFTVGYAKLNQVCSYKP